VPRTIVFHRTFNQSGELGRLVSSIVKDKFQARRMAQPKPTPHFAAQKTAGMSETDPHSFVRIQGRKRREVHAGSAHISGDINRRDSDIAHARVFYFARDELREHTLDLGFDASLYPHALRATFLRVEATRTM